jgi:hypothetical protein
MTTSVKNQSIEIPEHKETVSELASLGWSVVAQNKKSTILRQGNVTIKMSNQGFWNEVE